ncbi:MAG: EAL domain-containing protein [Acidimicrobiales bacterium]|jgi:EAL domain-containing protein (putative c-di-GMP-specific phosphodiesterase class I)/putative methionine-R-sulfoxide reductase with GAF domain
MALRDEHRGEEPGSPFAVRRAIEYLCEPGVVETLVQPVVRPADQLIVGYEALARMPLDPLRPPDWWLAKAEEVGMRVDLEIACLAAAARLGPAPEDRLLFVNLSPSLLAVPAAMDLLDRLPQRLVVELTEQEAVEDYDGLRHDLEPWLARGVRIAIDDAGAGYSSLRHVIELTPDFLKLDRELVRDLDRDRNRRALASAMAAFAAEVGTSVIAEGVETLAELDVLRDAEVDLVQGYLLARPGSPWPAVADRDQPPSRPVARMWGSGQAAAEARLVEALDRATDSRQACSSVVEHLFRQGQVMPSAYLERHEELRCVAQRGLWQILDGMSGSAGITGRTWKTGQPVVVPDVAKNPSYLEAIPGVVSEICVPITIGDKTIGALNVESLTPLPSGMLDQMVRCAGLLADRLHVIGDHLEESSWDRTVQASVAISGVPDSAQMPDRLLRCLRGASRLDSGTLIVDGPDGPSVEAVAGPLGEALIDLTTAELYSLSSLVNDIRSCYTGGDALGRGFVGTDSLRRAGARVVVVLPLWAQRARLGSVVLAHSRPLQLSGEEVRPLETLADHVASAMASRRRAQVPQPPPATWDRRVARRRGGPLPSRWERRAVPPAGPSPSADPSAAWSPAD